MIVTDLWGSRGQRSGSTCVPLAPGGGHPGGVSRMSTRLILPLVTVFLGVVMVTTGDIPEMDESMPGEPFDPDSGTEDDSSAPFGRSLYPPTDVRPCYKDRDQTPSHHIPLPRLDDQFEARIEAKILQKGYTVDVEEYYDYPNNRGMVRRMKAGVFSTWLYDFSNYESFLIVGNDCWLSDMRKEGFQFFNFTVGSDSGHIGGVTDLFNFGTQYNETFVKGNETVRGIPVNHWTSCVEWDRFGSVFQLDYYFSKPDYSTPIGRKEIPVRAILRGQARGRHEAFHTFHHIYDFVFYRPGPIRHPGVFEVPHGTVCEHRSIEKRKPDLPDSFQMQVEMVQPEDKIISLRQYYYDFNLKLSRYDLHPNSKSMVSWGDAYGYRPITLIHDYNRGIQYVIDSVSRNCTKSSITLDTVDADPRMTDPSHVIMRHGRELFDLDQLSFSYQGKRTYREISCEVWAALRVNWPQEGTNTTVEVYFNKPNWTVDTSQMEVKQPGIVGLWLTLVDSTDNYVSEWVNHIYDYEAGDPDLAVFDVHDCYSRKERIDIKLQIKATYRELLRRGLQYLHQALQVQLSEVAGLQPLRVTNIKFDATPSVDTLVTFTLLEEVIVKGDTLVPSVIITASDGYQSIMERANDEAGLLIMVPYPLQSKEYHVLPGSVIVIQTDAKQERRSEVQRHAGTQYSPGSMAGLGICMLLIGFCAGAGAMFFHKMKKRPLNVPYRVQD